jgi:uncharacterized membrane protein YkvA (DUF1232 family)
MSNQKFYEKLRNSIKSWVKSKTGKESKWVEYLLVAPDLFHLMCKLIADKNVPIKEKAKLALAIAYFVSPIDLIPEALVGPAGYVDDIALSAFVLNSIINNTSSEIVLKHWAGNNDVLHVIKDILKVADEMVGSGLWRKLKSYLGN